MNFDSVASDSAISLSFSESPVFLRPQASDDSSFPDASTTYDGVLRVPAPLPTGFWTQPSYALRGGFRYLMIVSNSESAITISNVSCAISFMPHVDNLRDYSGYFYAADPVFHDTDFLTKCTVSLNPWKQKWLIRVPSMVCWSLHCADQYRSAAYWPPGTYRFGWT